MRRWHLNADGLGERPGPERQLAHRTNLTIGYANPSLSPSADPTSWWRDQSRDDALSLIFDSPVLEESLDVVGEPVFHLRVRSDKPVAKLCARLMEVTPDGHSHFLCYGLLNLTHRDGHENPAPLAVGVTLFHLVEEENRTPSLFEKSTARRDLNATIDMLNDCYGKNTVYFGGAHNAKRSAPMRIAFNHVPDLKTDAD